jgi:hypothetical protein
VGQVIAMEFLVPKDYEIDVWFRPGCLQYSTGQLGTFTNGLFDVNDDEPAALGDRAASFEHGGGSRHRFGFIG